MAITKKTKKIVLGVSVLVIVLGSLTAYALRSLTLTEIYPNDGYAVQSPSVYVLGNVWPTWATVTVNGAATTRHGRLFKYILPLTAEKNPVSIVATNGKRSVRQTLTITRIFTDQEKADMAAAETKAKAMVAAFNASPAGRMCKGHSEWSMDDCARAARGDVWIGMNVFLLSAKRGHPDVNNKSNYGSGNEYQFCWYDYSPSCVYVKESDGLIYSYN